MLWHAATCCYCPGRLLGRAPELHCGTCALLAGWVVGAIGGVWERGPIEWVDPTTGHAIKVCVWDNACWGALLHPEHS